jgi:uncharacterized caspase-like protein/tetratricopeptide (TPR) repeat protein
MPLAVACTALFAQQVRDLRLEPSGPTGSGGEGARWALAIGISNHQNLPPQAQLHFAHRDAEEFAAFLESPAGGSLPASHLRLLTNEKATLAAIRAALHTWLVGSAGPNDTIYVFFAGHGVTAERDESFFVAYDSDPQNLHATALPFGEVDEALSERARAALTVIAVDACHSGNLGWASYSPDVASRAGDSLAKIGRGDRSFLKLLASRPSERSYEDARWNGGHGVFTYALIEGLRGQADRDGDGVVRASEAIEYLGRTVPGETESQQHPRIAGTFDALTPLAIARRPVQAAPVSTLEISGPAGSSIAVDRVPRGRLRADGTLRLEGLAAGRHSLAVEFADGETLEGTFALSAAASQMNIPKPAPTLTAALRARISAGQVLEAGGAWDLFQQRGAASGERAAAASLVAAALEEMGQACVSDYVQSTQAGLKRGMLARATEAFGKLQLLRPADKTIEPRRLFCGARLQIADGQFQAAVATLQQVLQRDPDFACAHNALGVALGRLNRPEESRRAFETAARLAPEWALPHFQIASQHIARGEHRQAQALLEKAVKLHPLSVLNRWHLMRVHRLTGRLEDVERDAAELIRLDANYAPTYLELARAREAAGTFTRAAEAYDSYLLLAPNFADSDDVRQRVQQIRDRAARPAPTLRKQ